MKRIERVFKKLFPLKVGAQVKVVRIWYKPRLKLIKESTFVGRKGIITAIEDSWIEKGWWGRPIPGARKVLAYRVRFTDGNSWVFMQEDLEIIG